ncbi:MAG: PKD domain-containing protein [Bacteroidales bacterium]|nr:PKD domain-containing protein [Bacteroidales bacterium]
MKYFLIVLLLSVFTVKAFSQGIEGTITKAKKQATVTLLSLPQQSPGVAKGIKVPNPGWQPPKWTFSESNVIYKQVMQNPKVRHTVRVLNSPAPDTTFPGLMDNGSSIPPDVNGAAGPNHLMETLNTEVRISDRNGNPLFTTTLSAWWNPMPGSGSTFDPKIVYDPYNSRWIMITPSGGNSTTTKLYIGVSTTDNPLDDWNFYWIETDPDQVLWFDYPNLGFNKNWISIGGIMRNSDFEAVEFVVFAMDKLAAYAGEEEPLVSRFTTTLGSAIVPASTYDTAIDDLYLVSTGNGNNNGYGYINLFKLGGAVDNPVFELKGSIGIPDPWENWSYENHGDFLPQLGSSEKLNSVDARMHTMIFRNNKLWAVHHIYLPANNPQRCAIQWWELDTAGVVLERGRIEDTSNTVSFAFPGIAVNANEDVFIGHGVYSYNDYAGAAYSFKDHLDDSGSMRTYYTYKAGLAPYYKTYGGGRNRWGDYSAVFVDPVHDLDFWAIHEYAELPSGNDLWGSWWAFMKPSFDPLADFTANDTLIPTGETIDFTDLTLGVPTSWQWIFEEGTPDSSSQQNPDGILFAQEGSFDIRLIASNALGTDTIIKTDFITTSSTILPEVDFSANKTVVCTGKEVVFTDHTLYRPVQWEWQFDPSTITFVNGTDESSQNPEVVFNEAKPYSVTLKAWNLNGESELTKFGMVTSGGYEPWYLETFEPESFKSNEWTIENPDESVTWELLEIGGTGPGNRAMGVQFPEYLIGQRDRLISPPFNLKWAEGPMLDFQHAYAKKYAPLTDSLIVYVSPDCGDTWERAFSGGEDGNGSFATHEQTTGFWPETNSDWCGTGWGANCNTIGLANWEMNANVRFAFESYSAIGNPLFIDNVMVSTVFGTNEDPEETNKLKIYPNPTNGAFTLVIPKEGNFSTLEMVNAMGSVVYRQKLKGVNGLIEVKPENRLSPGLWLLKLEGEGLWRSVKIIVR